MLSLLMAIILTRLPVNCVAGLASVHGYRGYALIYKCVLVRKSPNKEIAV